MAKSQQFSSYLLGLIFNGVAIPGIAQNAAAPLTDVYLSLHRGALAFGDPQDTLEATYGGYARRAVPRTALGFTLSGNRVTLANRVDFPEVVSGTETLTHWAIGVAAAGATMVLYSGPLDENINVVFGAMPRLQTISYVDES